MRAQAAGATCSGRLSPTNAEKLLIERRRLGQTQVEAARRYRVTRALYGAWERLGTEAEIRAPTVRIGSLQPHERCLLYRRRAGFTQARVAEELQCCRWQVNQMERGLASVDNLLWYWEH